MAKPIIKWVGGKSQIIDEVLSEFPKEMNDYHEPFLGGGSVLLALLSRVKHGEIIVRGSIHASDINEPLIYMYKNIQSNPDEVYAETIKLVEEFQSCENGELNRNPSTLQEALMNKENYYYWTRKQYNQLEDKTTIKCSAMFIFLNKTCFRGVYRVGPNGFNVPYGHYSKVEIIHETHLKEVSELIQGVQFTCGEYDLTKIQANDFAYLDPPYAPETATSFVRYTENGFNEHVDLFKKIDTMDGKVLMSNSNTSLVLSHFQSEKYTIRTLVCRRAIHSKNPATKTKEVLIKNYA